MNRLVLTAVILAAVASGTVVLGRAASTQAKNTLDGEVVRVARRDVGSVVKATGIIDPNFAPLHGHPRFERLLLTRPSGLVATKPGR
jgi:hypothetical protein